MHWLQDHEVLKLGRGGGRCRFFSWFQWARCQNICIEGYEQTNLVKKKVSARTHVSVCRLLFHCFSALKLIGSDDLHLLSPANKQGTALRTEGAALTCCTGECLASKSGLRGTSSSGLPGSFLDSSSGRRLSSTAERRNRLNGCRPSTLSQGSNTSTNVRQRIIIRK